MNRSPDRIDIHNRKHRFELALRNLEQDPRISQENKTLIQRFPGTKMLNVYSHLNGDDAGEDILRLHKLVSKAKSEPELTVQLCPRCRERVSSASRFC